MSGLWDRGSGDQPRHQREAGTSRSPLQVKAPSWGLQIIRFRPKRRNRGGGSGTALIAVCANYDSETDIRRAVRSAARASLSPASWLWCNDRSLSRCFPHSDSASPWGWCLWYSRQTVADVRTRSCASTPARTSSNATSRGSIGFESGEGDTGGSSWVR
jgi:hypothetical protein